MPRRDARIAANTWGGSSVGRASRSQCEGRGFDPLPLQILNENKALWNVHPVQDKRGITSLCGPGCKGARTCMKIGNSRFCAALWSVAYLPFAQLVAAD